MRKLLMSLSIFSILLALSSCESEQVGGSGRIVADKREMGDFTGISLSGSGTLMIKQGYKTSLMIQTDDNLLDHIKSEVSGGVLHIGPKEGLGSKNLMPSKGVFYHITIRDLDKLSVAGIGNVNTVEEIMGDHLDVKVSGAGHIRLDVEMEKVELSIDGAAKVHIKGETVDQIVNISGAGIYDGSGLKSKRARLNLSGAGDVTVNVSDVLDVRMSGAGFVKYKGSPKVSSQVSGIGSVKKID